MSITYLSHPSHDFSDLYLQVREKENRIFTLSQVAALPNIYKNHRHYAEWQARKISADRFINFLKNKNRPLKILDIGCGNGWFSHLMSSVKGTEVVGLDVNVPELNQACEVFIKGNLHFVYGDIFEKELFGGATFDLIVFNSCFQYFEDAPKLLKTVSEMLSANGEIHIIDTPFYEGNQVKIAKQRTKEYYQTLGFPEMAQHYFHHQFSVLGKYRVMYKPSIFSKLLKDCPFCWISIDKI